MGIRHKIALFIHLQIRFNKHTFFQAEMLRDPLHIRCFEPWRVAFTAIGTLQTIHFLKRFFMKIRELLQYLVLIRLFQELAIDFLPFL